jgi:hypothetical protein
VLVVAGGQASPLFELAEAAFDAAAAGVAVAVEAGRRPPAEPLRRRLAAWSAFSGMVWPIRRARSSPRLALEL